MSTTKADNTAENLLLIPVDFRRWLYDQQCSLAFTTYQRGRLFFVGLREDGALWVQERFFEHSQGLWADGEDIWLATYSQLWNLKNALPSGTASRDDHADRLYCPRVSYVTGALDIHDIGLMPDRRPLFVNTRFSCLAMPDPDNSFEPVWHPPFISRLAAEDRCHLNGMAMVDGQPRYVTALSRSDVADGWREKRQSGGVVISVPDNEIITDRLSMPHSPRLYRDKLWLLNSGTGEFGHIDLDDGRFVPLCFCPGYARGLAFAGDFAVIGLSRPRNNQTFDDLPLEAHLDSKQASARCGLIIVDLTSGDILHWLRFNHTVDELYDVSVIPGVRQPAALGLMDREKLAGFVTLAPPSQNDRPAELAIAQ